MRRSWTLVGLGAAGGAVLIALSLPGPAGAAAALQPNERRFATAADSYPFTTTQRVWSAVAVRPAATTNADLRLWDSAGVTLATSRRGTGATDFILINSRTGRSLGTYTADVTQSGGGGYYITYVERAVVLSVPTDPRGSTQTVLALSHASPIVTGDIFLRAGQGFRVRYPSGAQVYLAGSTAGTPATYVRNRTQVENAHVIADAVPAPGGIPSSCRVFRAPATGWYSVVGIFTTPLPMPPPTPGSGIGFFLQRYNPALGDTLTQCPDPVVTS